MMRSISAMASACETPVRGTTENCTAVGIMPRDVLYDAQSEHALVRRVRNDDEIVLRSR